MKKRERWKENLVTALEVPNSLAYKNAIVTITGPKLAVIENYRSIIRYTEEEIIIGTLRGRVKICGKRLEIPWYTPEEMQVKGNISSVFVEEK